jgi:hypothetical protein
LAPSSEIPMEGTRGRKRDRRSTASNLDTLLDRGFDRVVRMLLSFQRPSHLFRKVVLPRARPEPRRGSRGGPVSIAPNAGRTKEIERRRARPSSSREIPAHRRKWPDAPARPGIGEREPGHAHDAICTVTVRCRGRSSKSIRTTCCQVPSARRPSTSGIVSDGPITAARRCAWALVSWFRRLCS